MKEIIVKNYLLIVVIFIALLLRLNQLGNVPYGFANDEISYIISGYTIAQSGGYDIAGKFLPLSINLDSSMSPVPVYLIAVIANFVTLSPFLARLPFALLGVGSVILVYFITLEIFKKKKIAFLASLVLAISPWHLLVTRGVWDVIPAQFFYLLGIYIFLKNISSKRSIMWSLIPFTFAFYSYHATKVFFVAMLFVLLLVFWKEIVKRKRQSLAFLLLAILLISSFLLVLKTQSVTRQNELLINNESFLKDAAKYVDFNREKSEAPETIKRVVHNKGEFTFNKIVSTYINAFSPNHLFFVGDVNPVVGYGTFFKGVLYLIELPFLLIGLFLIIARSFYVKSKQSSIVPLLVLGLILVAPLPSAIGAGTTYIIRAFMLVPFFAIAIGYGVFGFFNFLNNKALRRLAFIVVCLLYIMFVSKFLYQYYYQFNYYGGEYWNRSSRELSEYIIAEKDKYDQIIVGQATDRLLLQYSFFSHSDDLISKAWINKWPAPVGKVIFSDSCLSREDYLSLSENDLYIANGVCEVVSENRTQISDHMEPQRVIWEIYD